MGKSYIENSLKRFLKRKVKITMGIVVSFLITGAVAFADTTISTSRGDITVPTGYENQIVVGTGNKIIIESGKEIHKVFPVSEEMKKLFNNSWETKGAAIYAIDGAIIENNGNMSFKDENNNNKVAGEIALYNGSKLINGENGIVDRVWSEDSDIYNYGRIAANEAQWSTFISKGKTNIYNYGEIHGGAYVMYFYAGQQNLYNYGLIKCNRDGYMLTYDGNENIKDDKFLNIYNYGILESQDIFFNFRPEDENVKIYNYNLIKNANDSQSKQESNIAINHRFKLGYQLINYGMIDVLRTVFQDPGFQNYGVIKEKNYVNTSGGISDKNFDNKGIYITSADITVKNINGEQKGAILTKSDNGYILLNGENSEAKIKIKDMSKETEINSTNTADNMFVNDKSLTLNLGNKITGKTITAVSQAEGNVILDNDTDGGKVSGNDNLTLDNTSIIGYFEKDGTLLKVDGDLTLTGNSIINAVAARDENGDILKDAQNVVAVDVFGKLTYTEGESHIFGTIKGGEGSKIVVNGTETTNPNELTETLSSSGNIYLNGKKWTKGETGSIELTGGTVHIDNGNGTLVGYLAKEENPTTKAGENVLNTTLDGMITGKGTLNINEIRFDLGDLEINNMEDTYKVNGNKDIIVQDALNKISVSGIFNKKTDGNGNLVLSLKSAEEMGIYDPVKQKEYEELVKNFKDSEEFYTLINTGDAEAIRNHLKVIDAILELLGTSGVKITRDITGAFTNAVIEFDKKADKGQWLTNAKYIGSDMEYEGTQYINGYDSDLNSMIAMAEYGIIENTSLGFALGGGDTKVDLKTLNGKSASFDGDNYYAGIYTKHSMNGFDMTGSLGYTISNLDVKNGGSADSDAVTLAGYIKKDVYITDSVKFEPNLSFTYDYIMQDKAEMGEGMTIDKGSSHIFEAGAGMNIVKEFALEKGTIELRTGAKYYLTNIERNEDVTGKFYNADVNLGNPEIDDNRGIVNVGFDYEHNSGFGINGKYEMMWSDSGDDSRITAGVSYRF